MTRSPIELFCTAKNTIYLFPPTPIRCDQFLNVPRTSPNVPKRLQNVSGTLPISDDLRALDGKVKSMMDYVSETSPNVPKRFPNVSETLQISDDLRALDEKVKSMMEKSQNMISNGRKADGTSIQTRASICKVCGKEDKAINLVGHIESNHLVGISIPCDCL